MPGPKPDDYVDGPILSFLVAAPRFDQFVVLCNPPLVENGALAALTEALSIRHPELKVCPELLPISNPRDYEALYRGMRAVCEKLQGALTGTTEFHILLSPGTPQMHATWVLLAKTVFPATTWQTSDHAHQAVAEPVRIPFDIEAELLEPARREGGKPLALRDSSLVVESAAMRRIVNEALLVAQSNETVLLLGEPGVGKECLARLVHQESRRHRGPFVVVNCGALPEALVESELFGHVRGAFTHADRDKRGLFEAANGGTILLDELGDLPLELQVKLLRVLQERTIRRVGATSETTISVRVVAATNQDLQAAVQERRFRQDLYGRLNVFPLHIPPLRERREDIGPLADRFLGLINAERAHDALPLVRLLPLARRRLEQYDWPGNVRELNHLLRRLAIRAENGTITDRAVKEVLPEPRVMAGKGQLKVNFEPGSNLTTILTEVERTILKDAWHRHGTQAAAATALGLKSQQAFQKRCRSCGVTAPNGTKGRVAQ